MKIAIAGYGVEGKANYRYFKNQGDVTIVDEREHIEDLPSGVATLLGEGVFKKLDGFDIVIRTAGLAPRKIKTDGKVWSATNEFFVKCPATIIGVTGSKGKGTTCSFIAGILRAAGKTVHLLGNIGVPSLEVLDNITPEDIVVYELSSFQLWDAEASPHVAVVLMIEPDHLDVHASFEEYVDAKSHIARFQHKDDTVIYASNNVSSKQIADTSSALKVAFPSDTTAHIADGYFWYGTQKLCPISTVRIAGEHNLYNACAAIDAARLFTRDVAAIRDGIASFSGLPHRLKFVRTVRNVDYYDDSIATTPGSSIAAMKSFAAPKIMIMGGSSKGGVYETLADAATQHNVRKVILIGDEADKIETAMQKKGVAAENLGSVVTMKYVVEYASRQAERGDVVILSPACASFGMFESYSDRGDQFITAVNEL